jgi:hypothetical protein
MREDGKEAVFLKRSILEIRTALPRYVMDNIHNYPEKMHLAFGELVATEVSRAAEERNQGVDDYIHALYRGDPDCDRTGL